MKTAHASFLALFIAAPLAAAGSDLTMPQGSVLTAEKHDGFTSERLAIGAFDGNEVPSIWAEGDRTLQVWQGRSDGRTTLQILEPLRKQLEASGYDVLFECRDADCGGFDFRYAQDLMPEPDMHVDLGNYRYLAAQKMAADGTPEYVSLMVSENRTRDFIHVTRLGPQAEGELVPVVNATMSDPMAEIDAGTAPTLDNQLLKNGMAVLDDLRFPTGSAALDGGDYASLAALAGLLNADHSLQIALVGHTDTEGAMVANLKLSKARAQAVRERLIQGYGVSSQQIDAEGVGYLAPLASNADAQGREQNRRVEVVLVSNG